MSFAVVAAAGGAVVGGLIAANGSKSAASTQAQAEQAANDTNLQMFNTQVGLQAPFRDTGLAANNRLAFLLGLGGQNPGSAGAPVSAGPAPTGPTPSFGGLSPQMLAPGADGVFAPSSAPQVESSAAIRARLAPQFGNDTSALEDAVQTQGASEQQALQQFQQSVQQFQLQQQAQQQASQPAPGQPASSNLAGFGSLNQPFSAADLAADGAPKFGPFDQAAPSAPNLGEFQDTTNLAQYGGATQLGQFNDTTNLAGFQDMPAFNADMMKDDPGYQFRLDQGTRGVNNSAAAKGGLLSGAAAKALDQYNQDYASGEYNNAFNRYQTTRGNTLQDYLTNQNTDQLNRSNSLSDYTTNRDTQNQNNANALQTYNTNVGTQQANRANALSDYQTNLGTQQQNFGNQNTAYNNDLNQYSLNRNNSLQDYQSAYDRFQQNRNNVINPLLSLLGAGQQATNSDSSAAQNFGSQSAAAITAAGNANAAGQVGSANAINSSIGGATSSFQNNQLMNLLLSRQPASSSTGVPPNPFFTGQ